MNDSERSRNFWIGNVILAIAMVVLLKIGALWEMMGVCVGAYFLLVDKKGPNDPR